MGPGFRGCQYNGEEEYVRWGVLGAVPEAVDGEGGMGRYTVGAVGGGGGGRSDFEGTLGLNHRASRLTGAACSEFWGTITRGISLK